VHFIAKSNTKIDIDINFDDIQVKNIYNTTLTIDNTLSWKKQIEQLASKLSSVGYSVRSLKSILSQKVEEKFIFLMCTPQCCTE